MRPKMGKRTGGGQRQSKTLPLSFFDPCWVFLRIGIAKLHGRDAESWGQNVLASVIHDSLPSQG
jgi:hypothetical protein